MMVFKNGVASLEVSKLCVVKSAFGSFGVCSSKNNDVSQKLPLVSKVNTLNLCPDILVLLVLILWSQIFIVLLCYNSFSLAAQCSGIGLAILKAAKPCLTIQC